jgi:hypothetical protein
MRRPYHDSIGNPPKKLRDFAHFSKSNHVFSVSGFHGRLAKRFSPFSHRFLECSLFHSEIQYLSRIFPAKITLLLSGYGTCAVVVWRVARGDLHLGVIMAV